MSLQHVPSFEPTLTARCERFFAIFAVLQRVASFWKRFKGVTCLQIRVRNMRCESALQVDQCNITLKACSNECNMLHATPSNIVARNMLHRLNTLLHDVAWCWMMLHEVWFGSNFMQHHPTSCNRVFKRCNMLRATMLDGVACNMLRSFERALSFMEKIIPDWNSSVQEFYSMFFAWQLYY